MTDKLREAAEKAPRYMRAYFHTFEPTGVDAVDAVLEAVALAGKAYHQTMQWSEAEEYGPAGYWSLIQSRANEAAAALASPPEQNLRVMVGHSKVLGGWGVFEETAPGEFCAIKGAFTTRQEADAAMRASPPEQAGDVGQMEYAGNTVSFMYQRAKAYGDEITRCWDVLREARGASAGKPLHEVLRAALATAPSAPLAQQGGQGEAERAAAIHYPDCWDTAAYPTMADALKEVYAHFRCTNHETHPADTALQAILEARDKGEDPALILDENSPLVDAARASLSTIYRREQVAKQMAPLYALASQPAAPVGPTDAQIQRLAVDHFGQHIKQHPRLLHFARALLAATLPDQQADGPGEPTSAERDQ